MGKKFSISFGLVIEWRRQGADRLNKPPAPNLGGVTAFSDVGWLVLHPLSGAGLEALILILGFLLTLGFNIWNEHIRIFINAHRLPALSNSRSSWGGEQESPADAWRRTRTRPQQPDERGRWGLERVCWNFAHHVDEVNSRHGRSRPNPVHPCLDLTRAGHTSPVSGTSVGLMILRNLFHALQVRTQTAMATENLLVNNGRYR